MPVSARYSHSVQNRSVFETIIRGVGGEVAPSPVSPLRDCRCRAAVCALAAADCASIIRPVVKVCNNLQVLGNGTEAAAMQEALLHMAVDLGDRLLPAFETATGIPYGLLTWHQCGSLCSGGKHRRGFVSVCPPMFLLFSAN